MTLRYAFRPLLAALALAAAAWGPAALAQTVTIAEARAAGSGATVTVEGTVSRAMGAFTYLQDATGGLTIRQTSGAFFDDVADGTIEPGTTLEVTGTLSEFNSLLQINEGNLDSYAVTGTTTVPAAQAVTLAQLAANGESFEAELVTLTDVTFADGGGTFASSSSYPISDPSADPSAVEARVPNGADSAVDGLTIPDVATTVTAVVGQFSGADPAAGYQLLLIGEDDVEGAGTGGGPVDVTVAEARALGAGAEVSLEVTVTRAMGAFTYAQDATGGITIRQTSGGFFDDVADGTIEPGTTLEVTGTLSEFNSLLQINGGDLAAYSVTGSTAVPTAQTVTLAELAADGEDYEGELVAVDMTMFADAGGTFAAGTDYAVSDPSDMTNSVPVRVGSAADTEVDGLAIPATPITVLGVVGQFSGSDPAAGYQILPILEADVDGSGTGGGTVTVAEARALGAGATVTLEVTVTRARGAFTYAQDATGGITIRQTSGGFFDDVADGTIEPGTTLEVTGTLSEFNSLLQINGGDLDSYTITGSGPVPAAQAVTLAELAANGEDYEGELVEVTDVSIDPAGAAAFMAGTNYAVTDPTDASNAVALRIVNAADTDLEGLAIPTMPTTVTAVVGQFSSADPAAGYQLLPILEDDVEGAGEAPPPAVVSILEARRLPLGTAVTVEGVVSRAEGAFTYVQDDEAGLTIRQTSGAFRDAVADGTIGPGTVLRLTGTLSEFRGLLQLNEGDLEAFEIVGTTAPPEPIPVTLEIISENGESLEGRLVTLPGVSVGGSDFFFEASTTYGVFDGTLTRDPVTLRVPNADDTTVDGTFRPDRADLTGVVGQFTFSFEDEGYQLLLIEADDVEALPPAGPGEATAIGSARANGPGALVTIEGVVTRAEGAFAYVQDGSGALAIRQTGGPFNAAVADGTIAPGTRVRLTGTLSEFSGSLQINGEDLSDFEVLGSAPVPEPQTLTLAQIAAAGEQYEDELVRVEMVTVEADGTFSASTTYAISDPSSSTGDVTLRVPNASDTEVDGTPIPDEPVTVTAILGQFSTDNPAAGYQLLVIEREDVGGDGGTGGGAEEVSLAGARDAGVGTAVVVEGVVTRAAGAFLYLQDETGGLTVRQTSGPLFDAVADGAVGPGTILRVTGTLSEFGNLLQINGGDLDTYEVLGTTDVPQPQVVTLAELAADGEDYEGELVRVNGVTVQGSGAFTAATTYGASDGSGAAGAVTIRVPNADDSTVDGTPVPAGPVDLVGVVGQFNFDDPTTGYQLLLLDVDDVDAETTGGTAAGDGPDAALALDVANPIRGGARVAFSVPEAGAARVALYDVLGREVAVLADGPVAAGAQTARLDAAALAPGVYVLRLEAADRALARTVTVVR